MSTTLPKAGRLERFLDYAVESIAENSDLTEREIDRLLFVALERATRDSSILPPDIDLFIDKRPFDR